MKCRLFDTVALLLSVVVEQSEGIFPKTYDSYKVAGGKQSHTKVSEIPNDFKTCQRSEHYQYTAREKPVNCKDDGGGMYKADVCLAIIIVSNDA